MTCRCSSVRQQDVGREKRRWNSRRSTRAFAAGVKKFVEAEINPHVDEWEEAGIFPAHDLFKKMGDQG